MRFGRITISGGFLIMLALVYFFDVNGFVPLVLLTALVHELGHFFAIWALGGRVMRLHLGLVGLCMDYEGGRIGYPGEIVIALAGPLLNLGLAYGASFLGRYIGSETAFFLAGISLGACVFNMLPVYQLDGGRVLYCILAWAGDVNLAFRVVCVISCVVIFVLLIAGFWLFVWSHWNFTLLTAALWLLISYCKNGGNAVRYIVANP